ncbi:MAG: class E sortase [Acidimicrobiales bacterium]|nr:class E sortase [Acidimicrobiales bacterium]
MTAVASAPRLLWRSRRTAVDLPRLPPRLQLARGVLVVVFVISASLVIQLVVVSNLQQRAAQQRAFDRFRSELATGTAPIGPVGADGRQLAQGTPVAYLEIPAIGLRQVIVEGTTSSALFTGPGHRRDSPLPGQAGVSVVLGRSAAFGGPFRQIDALERGDTIHVTTGQGEFDYRVTGRRSDGDPAPGPAGPGKGRLLLATAAGRPFMPDGVLRVDADLVTAAVGGAAPLVASRALPPAEQLMGADTGTLWALALWLQALTVVAIGAVWAWHRWGRAKAWVVFLPPLIFAGLSASGEAARLMPNLL